MGGTDGLGAVDCEKKETARFNTNGKNGRHSSAALLLLQVGTKHQLQVIMILLAMREPTEKIPRT